MDVEPQDPNIDKIAESEVEPLPRWRRWLMRVCLYTLCLSAGGSVCATAMWLNSRATVVEEPEPEFPFETQLATTTLTPEERLQSGDVHFMSGNYAAADTTYRQLLDEARGPDEMALRYRVALCGEKLGHTDEALSQYGRILEAPDISEGMRTAARLGKARAWQQNHRLEPAKALLWMTLSASPSTAYMAHVTHSIAGLMAQEIQPIRSSLFDDRVVLTRLATRDEEYLLQIPNFTAGSRTDTESESSVEVLDRFSQHPRDIHVRVTYQGVVADLLSQIESAAAISLSVPEDVHELLGQRSTTVDVPEINLATMLDALLEPAGLVWIEQQGQIAVNRPEQFESDVMVSHRLSQTLRLCRTALAMYPEHKLAEQTLLCLGNVSFWAGEYGDALSPYMELERRIEASTSLAAVWFNQAKTRLHLNQREESREAFFRVVDVAHGKSIEAVAYVYLGRLFLEDLDVGEANRHLARGLARARDAEASGVGALMLAGGYLMDGNPVAANQTLHDQRTHLRDAPYNTTAVFLSALARFRATIESRDRLRRGRELTAALTAVEPDRFFSVVGPLLVGEAYGEIGLPRQRLAVFQRAVSRTSPSQMQQRLMHSVARDLVESGQVTEGAEEYRRLADGSGSHWDVLARIELAKLAYANSSDDECLTRCYELLSVENPEVDKSEVLRLMGRVYERQADHYKAALCFAGMVPTINPDDLSTQAAD